jgi:hypothetical protein
LTFSLDNSATNSTHTLGLYSLYNASKRSGWALGINCRFSLVDPNTLSHWPQFVGRIDAIDPVPGKLGQRSVRVSAVGWMDEAARWALTADVAEQIDKTWDEVLAAIIAEMPSPPTATDFEPGIEPFPYSLDTAAFSAQPALSEFKKIADSERGLLYIKADGTLKGEGRHSRLLMTTSGWTLSENDIVALSLPSTRDEIINTLRVTVHPRKVTATPTDIVYSQANVIELSAGASKLLLGAFRDPDTGLAIGATDIQTLIPITDYTANTASDGSGTDLTSFVTVTVLVGPSGLNMTVENGAAVTGYLTFLQVRGRAIRDTVPFTMEAHDDASIALNGEHAVIIDMPYQANADVGQGAADYYLSKYSTAFAQARSVSVTGRTTALMSAMLARDISDRITISETVTGVNNDYFINAVELRVLSSGQIASTYTLAPAQDPFAGLYWVVDVGVLGTSTIPAPF